jgi:glycosyltransferase involved in cell wall biosynthesis
LESVLRFDLPPDVDFEILVLDGCSSDNTVPLARKVADLDNRVRILPNSDKFQSHALNLAVKHARGDWIMRLDAHANYPRDYLRLCYETAKRTHADNVGGLVITEISSVSFGAKLVQGMTTHRFGVGNSAFRVGAKESRSDTVPYGFFRREIFECIGLFDERLLRAQDYEFNRRIVASGGMVWLNPAIRATYFNQATLRGFYSKQLLREAPYNAYLWYLAPYAFAVRHATTLAFAIGVICGAILAPLTPWVAWPYASVLVLYVLLALGSSIQQAVRYRVWGHVFVLPVCFFLYHFLHGLGILVGLIRLITCTAPVQCDGEPWLGAGRRRLAPLPNVLRSTFN